MSNAITLNFMSDNVWGMHPNILQAIQKTAQGTELAYGADKITENLRKTCQQLFEADVELIPIQSGTAANALSLSLCSGPINRILCHPEAHIWTSECGAVENLSAASLETIPSDDDKVSAADLDKLLQEQRLAIHCQIPSVVSLSQTTENGSVYSLDEIQEISHICRYHQVKLHVDGARFANAAASPMLAKYSLAELTWKAGIDILSFGFTKNGAMTAEAVIIFDPSLKQHVWYKTKRAGFVASKMRFVSAQIAAMLEDNLWRHLGKHANDLCQTLKQGLLKHDAITLASPSPTNQLFVHMPQNLQQYLVKQGVLFYDWPALGKNAIRLICSSEMDLASVNQLIDLVDGYYEKAS